jgi:hypothetical protein
MTEILPETINEAPDFRHQIRVTIGRLHNLLQHSCNGMTRERPYLLLILSKYPERIDYALERLFTLSDEQRGIGGRCACNTEESARIEIERVRHGLAALGAEGRALGLVRGLY